MSHKTPREVEDSSTITPWLTLRDAIPDVQPVVFAISFPRLQRVMLEVKEQKVEEDFCLWLGYDGEDAVQVVWILVRETWRLNSAIGGSEVSRAVLGACRGRKKPTALATMQLNANSLTHCGNPILSLEGLCVQFWKCLVTQELCEFL